MAHLGVGMASIQHRQRADGTVAHRVMFREKPGGRIVSETFNTADQAVYFRDLVERIGGAAAREKRAQADREQGPTLTEVLDHYIESAPDIQPGTAVEYRRQLCRSGFDEHVGGLGVEMIDRADVEAWVRKRAQTPTKRTGRPPAAKTVANEHGLISTIFAHAVERSWCAVNPAKGVRLPKPVHREREILTDAEFIKLWSAMSDRYKPLVWLLGATGLRWGEATALQWRDITGATITVQRAWKHAGGSDRELGAPKTAKGFRRIETTPNVIASLGEPGKPDALVFPNARGDRINYQTFYREHWQPACESAGVASTIHGLRHWAASYMLAQGADIFEVSRALGHNDISTTTHVYGHLVVSKTRPTLVHATAMDALRTKALEA